MEYLLTIRKSFEAVDDVEARKSFSVFLNDLKLPDGTSVKLQEIQPDKPPRSVQTSQ